MQASGSSGAQTVIAPALTEGAKPDPSVVRNLLMVYSVSLLDMSLSVLANVVVPLAASKEAFADYRKVILYAGYAGLFHFGLLSGMYLAVVGKAADLVDWRLIRTVRAVLLALQCLLLAALGAVALTVFSGTSSAWVGVVSVACWGAMNLTTFYNYLLQGTNRFRPFFLVNVSVKLAALAVLCVVAMLGLATTRTLVFAFAAPVFATAAIYEWGWRAQRVSRAKGWAPWSEVRAMWRRGFVLHLANVCLSMLFTVGSLAVSLLFGRIEFADYAFVSGLVTVLYVAVDGLTAAATPLLARADRAAADSGPDASYRLYAGLLWLVPAVYWCAVPAVERFVPAYARSLPMLLVLCCSLPMSLIVRSRAVAIETAAGRQGSLLRLTGWGFVCSVVAVLSAFAIGRSPYAVAVGWTIAMIAIGSSRFFAGDATRGRSLRFEQRLVIEAAVATLLFFACAAWGRSPILIGVYLIGAALAFELRRRAHRPALEGAR